MSGETGPVTRSEFGNLVSRVSELENRVRGDMLNRRETGIKNLGYLEDALKVNRTMPRLDTLERIDEYIDYLQRKRAQIERDIERGSQKK